MYSVVLKIACRVDVASYHTGRITHRVVEFVVRRSKLDSCDSSHYLVTGGYFSRQNGRQSQEYVRTYVRTYVRGSEKH